MMQQQNHTYDNNNNCVSDCGRNDHDNNMCQHPPGSFGCHNDILNRAIDDINENSL
jgi:hypothetical protein